MSRASLIRALPRWPRSLLILMLAGCASTGPAPVSDRPLPGSSTQAPPRAVAAKPDPAPAPAVAPAPAPSATPIPPPAKPEAGVVVKPLAAPEVPTYTVKQGDTLFSIAKANGVSVRDLVAWNNIGDAGSISVGQQLRLATPEGVSATPVKPPGATDAAPRAAEGNLKTQPLGQRVPYSEQAYAQMVKGQAAQKVDAKVDSKPEPKTEAKAERKPEAKPEVKTEAEAAKPGTKPEPSPAANNDSAWIWPTEGKIVGNFDEGKNKGITIAGKRGQPVYASAAGRVIFSGTGLRGLGRLVVIRHPNNYLTVYAHNDKLLVKEGQNVTKGQRIAEMGNSDTDSVKLHFEIRRQGKPVDPIKLLPGT